MRRLCILIFCLPSLAFAEPTHLQKMPLWELGFGGGATYTPDYPGSDQSHLWAIPFPFALYRGEILHSDRRGGTRARLFKSVGYEFNVSAGGGLPTSSSGNRARRGMPNLEWLGEFGPRLMLDLMSDMESGRLFRLGFPIRAAFSTNFEHLTDRGFVFAPELLYDHPRLFGTSVDGFTLLTVNFADARFNDYFYSVKPEFATRERPEYRARGGYLLTDLTAGLVVPLGNQGKFVVAGGLSSLDGSANRSSPLHRSLWNSSISVVIVWVFAKSDVRVVTDD